MMGLCFRVYVRRSQGAGTDPAKDNMPRACRRGQGLPSDLPKDSLCLHLVGIDCKFVVRKVFGMTLPKTACSGHAIVSQPRSLQQTRCPCRLSHLSPDLYSKGGCTRITTLGQQ